MENKRKSIIIGLSFLAAMVLFIWGFNFLKGKKLFHFQPYYYAVFDNAGGIEPANQVLVSGVSVGQVDDIYLNPDNDGTVILKFSINETIKIPENTVVSISSSLLGYSSVSLVLGNSTTVANVGDTLLSRTNMGVMNALSSQLIPLKDKVENLVMSLDTLTASLNALLDDGLRDDIKNRVKDFSSSMQNLSELSYGVNNTFNDEKDKIHDIIDNFNNASANLSSISDTLSAMEYGDIITSLHSTINELDILISNLNRGQGSIGLMMTEDSLYNNANEAVEALQRLVKAIEENPKKYIRIKVF